MITKRLMPGATLVAAMMMLALPGRCHAACAGDCNGSGTVTVDELIRGVNIALGNGSVAQCASFDLNGDGTVTINELINAVNGALAGCDVAATGTATPTPTATPSPSGPTPTAVASCGDGSFAVTFSEVSPGSNVTPDTLALGKGVALDVGSGNGTYVWVITGDPCTQGNGEAVRLFSINVSDAPTRLVPGTYSIPLSSPPFIRVDYRETKFVFGNPSQSYAHQWLSTGGTLEVSDAGGGGLRIHASDVTMQPGALTPSAVGTFTIDISGTVGKVTHN